jgi:hypothetical protein
MLQEIEDIGRENVEIKVQSLEEWEQCERENSEATEIVLEN